MSCGEKPTRFADPQGSYGFGERDHVAAEMEELAKAWLAGDGTPAERGPAARLLVARLRAAFGPPPRPRACPTSSSSRTTPP